MVNINNNAQWFQSADGVAEFQKITTVEERTLFLQAYLEKLTDEAKEGKPHDYERANLKKKNFRFALFLADAIFGSVLPYSKYPALIDENQNPFIKDWKQSTYGKLLFRSGLSDKLLLESRRLFPTTANNSFKKALIDENKSLQSEKFGKTILNISPDTTIFDVDPALETIQLKIMCLFDGN